MNFVPTYLMIKRHQITGLMYFCKTGTRDPLRYHGSGKYWKNHLKVHGRHIETLWHQRFDDKENLVEFALFFSEFHDIVHAMVDGRKIWANEVPEDGLQGGQNRGMPSPQKGIKQPHVTLALKGKKRPEHSKMMKDVPKSEEHKQHIAEALRNHVRTKEHGENISKAKKGKRHTNKRIYNFVICPHCATEGKGPNMTRYHFENCKHKIKENTL